MEGIRGFSKGMCATLGKGVYQYATSGTYIEPECKARRNGFHFVEYAPDCLGYYGLGKGNRYFLINAGGDINEEQGQVCSCTEMTLLKELNMEQFVIKIMEYMVRNPRMDWERNITMCQIARDRATAEQKGAIAIARGVHPKVTAVKGSYLGLVRENERGMIVYAMPVKAEKDGIYTINEKNELEVVDK